MIHVIVTDRTIEVSGYSEIPEQQKDMADSIVFLAVRVFSAALEDVTGQSEAILKSEDNLFLLDRQRLNADSRILEKTLLHTLSAMADIYAGYMDMVDAETDQGQGRLDMRISKASFSGMNAEDIRVLFVALATVPGVNHATIRFDDGTGLFLSGDLGCCPEYGVIDQDGFIDGFPVGYVRDMGAFFTLTDDQDRPMSAARSGQGVNGLKEGDLK